jgi:hypothetical protein
MKILQPNLLRTCDVKRLTILISLLIPFVIYHDGLSSSNAQDLTLQENSTSSNESLQENTTSESGTQTLLLGIFGTIVSVASTTVAILTYRYQKKMAIATYHYQKKQYKLNALIQIFIMLSNEKHISARENVQQVYEKYISESDAEKKDILLFVQPGVKNDVDLVKADFDQVGALIKNKLIDKSTILDTYGPTIVDCWTYLEAHVNSLAENEKYMSNFKFIADEARKHLSGK